MEFGKKRWVTGLMVMAVLLVLMAGSAAAARPVENDPDVLRQLAEVRRVTAKYHDLQAALDDGYVLDEVCAASPAGGMGYHAVNGALFADPALSATQPEALLYARYGNGYRLVAVEWVTPDIGQPHPELFGVPFDGPMPGHNPQMPVHYDLHAWIWFPNPNGTFAQWNPLVTCPQ